MESLRISFCKKIYDEYIQFKFTMLSKTKKDIFGEAYKIEIFANLYEILIEKSEVLSDEILKRLLNIPGLLELLYACWLKKEDGWFDELLIHVEAELNKTMAALGTA